MEVRMRKRVIGKKRIWKIRPVRLTLAKSPVMETNKARSVAKNRNIEPNLFITDY